MRGGIDGHPPRLTGESRYPWWATEVGAVDVDYPNPMATPRLRRFVRPCTERAGVLKKEPCRSVGKTGIELAFGEVDDLDRQPCLKGGAFALGRC